MSLEGYIRRCDGCGAKALSIGRRLRPSTWTTSFGAGFGPLRYQLDWCVICTAERSERWPRGTFDEALRLREISPSTPDRDLIASAIVNLRGAPGGGRWPARPFALLPASKGTHA